LHETSRRDFRRTRFVYRAIRERILLTWNRCISQLTCSLAFLLFILMLILHLHCQTMKQRSYFCYVVKLIFSPIITLYNVMPQTLSAVTTSNFCFWLSCVPEFIRCILSCEDFISKSCATIWDTAFSEKTSWLVFTRQFSPPIPTHHLLLSFFNAVAAGGLFRCLLFSIDSAYQLTPTLCYG